MKTIFLLSLASGGLSGAQLAQIATDPSITNYIDAGSTVVLTGLLVLIFKGIFIDQRWIPAKDAEHDTKVEAYLVRILLALQQDPDAPG